MELAEELYFTSRKEWRDWLKKNYDIKNEVWLIYYKKHTDKPRISYDDAVEEALCFGWIDSIVRRVDDERYAQKFTPRKSGSVWSEANKRRVEKLMREGRMTEAGLVMVREAKERGEWFKRRIRKESVVPPFMEEALAANKKALENFSKLAPSYQEEIHWVGFECKERRNTQKTFEGSS